MTERINKGELTKHEAWHQAPAASLGVGDWVPHVGGRPLQSSGDEHDEIRVVESATLHPNSVVIRYEGYPVGVHYARHRLLWTGFSPAQRAAFEGRRWR